LPSRGEIWLADLDPVRGHEQAGTRPVLVLSADLLNHGPARLVIVAPLTAVQRAIPSRVPLLPPEGGIKKNSFVICEAVRSISRDRLSRPLGKIFPASLERVEDSIRILLDL
jgi:mRNA interferase MazF